MAAIHSMQIGEEVYKTHEDCTVCDDEGGGSGQPGKDGFSPVANVVKKDNVSTFTVTDKKGTTSVDIYDGASITAVKIADDGTLECTLSNGTVVKSTGTLTGADAILSKDFTPNVSQGNVEAGVLLPKGTPLEDIIISMLSQYIKPTVEITLNPSATVYDAVSGSIASITLSGKVTKGSAKVQKLEFFAGGTVLHTVTTSVEEGGTFSYKYTPATPITKDTVFKTVVTDVEAGTASASKTVVFIGRSYYGIIGADIVSPVESDIKTLNTTLKNSKKYVYQGITTDWGKVCYAYPASLGKLTSIKDKVNNFNYTESFTYSSVTVDGIAYHVYTLTDPTGADNVELTFE